MNGLYIVTPDWDDTLKLLAVTEQALLGGASIEHTTLIGSVNSCSG
ncbi:hypothetical protein ACFS07_09600 [Undibacterium arcticum]